MNDNEDDFTFNVNKLLSDMGVKTIKEMDSDPFIHKFDNNAIHFWVKDGKCEQIASIYDRGYEGILKYNH